MDFRLDRGLRFRFRPDRDLGSDRSGILRLRSRAQKFVAGMGSCLCLALLVSSLISCGSPQAKPNIVFILADDLGWTDLGGHGQFLLPDTPAGLTPSPGHVLDGLSLLPLFSGQGCWEREALYWHFPAYLEGEAEGALDPFFRTRPAATVLAGTGPDPSQSRIRFPEIGGFQ